MWLEERKKVFRQWVESRWPSNPQMDLLTWRPAPPIFPFVEEYIWQNGKLYKQVKEYTQQPFIPSPQPPKQLEWYVGDVPGWYITWCSNSTQPGNYSYEIH